MGCTISVGELRIASRIRIKEFIELRFTALFG